MSQNHTLGRRGTTARRGPDGLSVVYHQTEVVHQLPDGGIVLDSGGWRTLTTKTRMNQAANQYGLDFQVSQKDFSWFVDWKGATIPFTDGMILR